MKLSLSAILRSLTVLSTGIIALTALPARAQSLMSLLYNPQVNSTLQLNQWQIGEISSANQQIGSFVYDIESLNRESQRCHSMHSIQDKNRCFTNYQTAVRTKVGRIESIENYVFSQVLTPQQQNVLLSIVNSPY